MNLKFYFNQILLSLFFIISIEINAQSDNWLWGIALGGTDYDNGWCMAIDESGNFYTTGVFRGTTDLDPSGGVFNLTSAGNNIMIKGNAVILLNKCNNNLARQVYF